MLRVGAIVGDGSTPAIRLNPGSNGWIAGRHVGQPPVPLRQSVNGDIGLRLTFGRPPPLPGPVAAAAPAAARSYLLFFNWDKATLTNRARQIIRKVADSSTHVQYTRIEVNGYTDTSGTPKYN